jgi:hypothetical protein
MKLKLLATLLTAAFSLCLGCQTGKQKTSPEMTEVLAKRRLNKWEMDVAGMPMHSDVDTSFEKLGDEVFVLPEKPRTFDAFLYRVVVRKSEHRFWIERGGGIGGSTVVFGPAEIGK